MRRVHHNSVNLRAYTYPGVRRGSVRRSGSSDSFFRAEPKQRDGQQIRRLLHEVKTEIKNRQKIFWSDLLSGVGVGGLVGGFGTWLVTSFIGPGSSWSTSWMGAGVGAGALALIFIGLHFHFGKDTKVYELRKATTRNERKQFFWPILALTRRIDELLEKIPMDYDPLGDSISKTLSDIAKELGIESDMAWIQSWCRGVLSSKRLFLGHAIGENLNLILDRFYETSEAQRVDQLKEFRQSIERYGRLDLRTEFFRDGRVYLRIKNHHPQVLEKFKSARTTTNV